MKQPKYNWIWEDELIKYAEAYDTTLERFIASSEINYIRFPDGDSGNKRMYVYEFNLQNGQQGNSLEDSEDNRRDEGTSVGEE